MKTTICLLFALSTMIACTTSKSTAEPRVKLRGGMYEEINPIKQKNLTKEKTYQQRNYSNTVAEEIIKPEN